MPERNRACAVGFGASLIDDAVDRGIAVRSELRWAVDGCRMEHVTETQSQIILPTHERRVEFALGTHQIAGDRVEVERARHQPNANTGQVRTNHFSNVFEERAA